MKKIYSLLLLAIASFSTFAAKHTITASGMSFSPSTLTINEGDTVVFNIDNTHNAVEVNQATYNANGTTPLANGFSLPLGGGTVLPTQLTVGTHYYVCTPHASMGMKGTIIVQSATPVDSVMVHTNNNAPATITTNGGNLQLMAMVYPSGANQGVTWSISPTGSNLAEINNSGLVTAKGNGIIYAKAVSNADASKADSIQITITNQSLSIDDVKALGINIYPNPSSNILYVDITNYNENISINIIDMQGKIILNNKINRSNNSGIQNIDISNLTLGNYILLIKGNNWEAKSNFIKQ